MNEFEKPIGERNIEKDRIRFVEEISTVAIEEIPTEFDEGASYSIEKKLAQSKLFVLGEMHGVKENVDVMYTLFKHYGFRQLALEWKPALQIIAEKYLETEEIDFAAIQDSPDGRITAGHFALIKKLKDEGLLDKLICFNEGSGGGSWDVRDMAMKKQLLTNHGDVLTLAVAGRLHAKSGPVTFEDESGEHHPLGELVKNEVPETAFGRIEYRSGQYHNYGINSFDTEGSKSISSARFYQDNDGTYVYEVPEAHAAVVPNPEERL